MSSDKEIDVCLTAVYDFIAQAKFKKAFVCAAKVLDQRSPLSPPTVATDEDQLRELFLFTINKYADQLEQEGKIEHVFEIIEQGLEYFPGHPELLNETGVRLQSFFATPLNCPSLVALTIFVCLISSSWNYLFITISWGGSERRAQKLGAS
uniref:Uncharacterized protein n=1 Tax=Anopheles marajoara TaxID=58244 RepID=A0A2M4C2H1_9DIPT